MRACREYTAPALAIDRSSTRWRTIAFRILGPKRQSLPLKVLVDVRGLEPLTPCLQSRCSPS